MKSSENNFGLIKADEMFTIERVLCNGRLGSAIVISVDNVFLKVRLNGSVSLVDIELFAREWNSINSLGEMGIIFIFDTFKKLFESFVWLKDSVTT